MADTVELMRKRVLDMAIRGELVEQGDTDEPASILYEKILAEKEKMVKEKKIKKDKPLPDIEVDEIPFDIPESWKWVRLANVSKSIVAGGDKPKEFSLDKTEGYTIPVIANGIKNNGIVGYSKEATIHEESITVSGRGTIGYSAIRTEPFIPIVRLVVINPSKKISVPYLKYTLDALLETGVGTSIQQLTVPMIKPKVIPLPPLAEQKRIVAKIEEIFAVIDQIGTKKEEALSIIKNMRQTALQDAIMGVLVEQDENEEPASVLYEKIQAEKEKLVKEKKMKKEKPLPEIEVGEIPFDIPESWHWVRLGDISILLNGDRGKNYPGKRYWVDEGIPFINAGTLNNRYLTKDNMNFIPEERYELLRSGFVEKNDIIYCLRGSLGKISINKDFDKGAIASSVVIIRSIGDTNVDYLYYLLTSDYGKDLIKKVDSGTAQPNLSAKNVSKYIIPLPPLAEQHRIVETLEEIMVICDQMEAIFDGTSEMNMNLNAV